MNKKIIISVLAVVGVAFTILILANQSAELIVEVEGKVADAVTEERESVEEKTLVFSDERLDKYLGFVPRDLTSKLASGEIAQDEFELIPSSIRLEFPEALCTENELGKTNVCILSKGDFSWILADGINTTSSDDLIDVANVYEQFGNPEQVRSVTKSIEDESTLVYALDYPSYGYTIFTNGYDESSKMYGLAKYTPLLLAGEYNPKLQELNTFGLVMYQH